MSLTALTLLAIGAKQLVGVSAQNGAISSDAICGSTYDWMDNDLNQSPCLVNAYLEAPCFEEVYTVASISPGSYYVPAGNGSDLCSCSTVTYSVVAACALCQGALAGNWSTWSINCSESDSPAPGVYTMPIPGGTSVPHWAYYDVTSGNTLNVTAVELEAEAQGFTDVPGLTLITTTTMMITTTASPTVSTTLTPSSSFTSSFSSSEGVTHKSSDAGAIAGGIVGGFVALGIIGLVIAMFLSRRRRNQRAASSEYGVDNTQPVDVPPQSPQMTQENHHSSYGVGAQAPPGRYDPSDPNTYPTSTPVTGYTSSTRLAPNTPRGQSGSYNYFPEI